jgi:hypothetical protein
MIKAQLHHAKRVVKFSMPWCEVAQDLEPTDIPGNVSCDASLCLNNPVSSSVANEEGSEEKQYM